MIVTIVLPVLVALGVIAIAAPLRRRDVRSLVTGHDRRAPRKPRRLSRSRSRRRSAAAAAAYPHAVELLILAIRCGYLPRQAMAAVADRVDPTISAAFQRVVDKSERSTRFADALITLVDDIGPSATPLVDTLSAADRYGLALGPTLDRLAADARDQQWRDAEARVRQLPVRLAAPMVLCTLPSFVFLAIAPLLIGALSSLRR